MCQPLRPTAWWSWPILCRRRQKRSASIVCDAGGCRSRMSKCETNFRVNQNPLLGETDMKTCYKSIFRTLVVACVVSTAEMLTPNQAEAERLWAAGTAWRQRGFQCPRSLRERAVPGLVASAGARCWFRGVFPFDLARRGRGTFPRQRSEVRRVGAGPGGGIRLPDRLFAARPWQSPGPDAALQCRHLGLESGQRDSDRAGLANDPADLPAAAAAACGGDKPCWCTFRSNCPRPC